MNDINPRYMSVTVDAISGAYGLSNEGFRGVGIHKNEQYNFSILARNREGALKN